MALLYPLATYLFFSSAFVPLYAAARDNTTTGDSQPHHSKKIMNQIDACWRSDPGWASNRELLADCAVGFGKVTDRSDDAANPKPGTLRYGAIQTQPLWIVFKEDMVIRLESELMMNSFKTIDGRGAKVAIAEGPCIRIQEVHHIIIHGLRIHTTALLGGRPWPVAPRRMSSSREAMKGMPSPYLLIRRTCGSTTASCLILRMASST